MIVKRLPRFLLLGLILTVLGLPGLALASQTATSHTVPHVPTDVLTATLGSSADNTLYEDPNGSLSNGAGQYFFAGRTNQASNSIRRGLIRFDVSSSLPPTATIVGATLQLAMSQTAAGPQPIELRRVTASWGEGSSNAITMGGGGGAPATPNDATWLHRFYSSTLWTTPGGDFVSTASATMTVGSDGAYSWSAPGMISDVQMWLDAPATNEGWLVLGNELTAGTTKRFDTKENSDPNARPSLVITYLLLPYKVYLPLVSK